MRQYYQENSKELRTILAKLAPGPPAYHDLQWRLDMTVRERAHGAANGTVNAWLMALSVCGGALYTGPPSAREPLRSSPGSADVPASAGSAGRDRCAGRARGYLRVACVQALTKGTAGGPGARSRCRRQVPSFGNGPRQPAKPCDEPRGRSVGSEDCLRTPHRPQHQVTEARGPAARRPIPGKAFPPPLFFFLAPPAHS